MFEKTFEKLFAMFNTENTANLEPEERGALRAKDANYLR